MFSETELENQTPGKILSLGEGRNSVYATSIGWRVDVILTVGKKPKS